MCLDNKGVISLLRQFAPDEYVSKRELHRIESTDGQARTVATHLLVFTAVGLAVRARQAGTMMPIDVLLLLGIVISLGARWRHRSRWSASAPTTGNC